MTAVVAPREHYEQLLERAKVALAEGREIEGGIDPHQADRSPYQPRKFFNAESLARLANSMKTVGQIYPGIVRRVKGRPEKPFEVLDGERRWRAAKSKGLPYRAILVKIDDEAAAFLIAAIANLNRETHTPLEICDSIVGMLELGIPMPEVADMLGISVFWATQLYGLRNLHPEVRDMLDPTLKRDQMLPVTAAIQISKAVPSIQVRLARRALAKKISLKGLRAEVLKASEKAGTYVRQRTMQPGKRWRSVAALSGQVLRIGQDLGGILRGDSGLEVVRSRSIFEVRHAANQLAEASDLLAAASKFLLKAKK